MSGEPAELTPAYLLARLDAIGASLAQTEHALALLGLGSVGQAVARLDPFSDLDFFVMVASGHKSAFIQKLDWLAAAHPVVWSIQNTVDGHKALMADGVFCEFAVFEPHELARIPYAPGRVVWRRDGFVDAIESPTMPMPAAALPSRDWVIGEALSCLFVGLQRWNRGEKLSAMRFIQGHALDRLIELDEWALLEACTPNAAKDPFNRERRLEARSPKLAAALPILACGYDQTLRAADAILAELHSRMTAQERNASAPMSVRISRFAKP